MMDLEYNDEVRVRALELALRQAHFGMATLQSPERPSTDEVIDVAGRFETFIHGNKGVTTNGE
jgi:hypothetical protein